MQVYNVMVHIYTYMCIYIHTHTHTLCTLYTPTPTHPPTHIPTPTHTYPVPTHPHPHPHPHPLSYYHTIYTPSPPPSPLSSIHCTNCCAAYHSYLPLVHPPTHRAAASLLLCQWTESVCPMPCVPTCDTRGLGYADQGGQVQQLQRGNGR